MSGDNDNRPRGGTKGDPARAERLAAQLRENLKRRKAQSRSRKSAEAKNADETGDEPQ